MFEDIPEYFKNGSCFYFIVFFMLFGPVLSDSNFVIQRMVQYEVSGVMYGSKSSAINLEARGINSEFNHRTCIIAHFQDLGIDKFREIASKAGGLIITLPKNLNMSLDNFENLLNVEHAMIHSEVPIPVYFTKFNEDIDEIVREISEGSSKKLETAGASMIKKISESGFQVVVSGTHSPKKDSKIPIIQGELIPKKSSSTKPSEEGHPVILITTQIKNFGVTSIEPTNYDASVLFALAEQLSKLYNQASSSPKYRIIFMLHESGSLLNFQGAKKFLDVNLEETNFVNPEFVLCLDSIVEYDELFMHVSKPIQTSSGPVSRFYEILKKKADQYQKPTKETSVEVVHSKINLADTFFKWAHERFSMRRFAAFTISSIKSHANPIRTTIFNEVKSTDANKQSTSVQENIETKTKILAEALASYIFQQTDEGASEVFSERIDVHPYISPQSMSKSNNIKRTFDKFLKNVKQYSEKPDTIDPEFMFYDGEEAVLNVYKVKPAVFDLFLTMLLGCYLLIIYFIIIHFPTLYAIVSKPFATTNNGINPKTRRD